MSTATPFKTPRRLLITKLVRSRDAWKAKANARKAQRKTLEIRVRDLEASRELHRQRAEQLLLQNQQLQLESARAAVAAPTPVDAPKNSTDPAAGTTTSPSPRTASGRPPASVTV